jgi:hypothetical protein
VEDHPEWVKKHPEAIEAAKKWEAWRDKHPFEWARNHCEWVERHPEWAREHPEAAQAARNADEMRDHPVEWARNHPEWVENRPEWAKKHPEAAEAAKKADRLRERKKKIHGPLPAWLEPIMIRAARRAHVPMWWVTSRGLYEILLDESGFQPTAQNPTSTAYGLFQFLDGTWAGVGGYKTSDPYLQCVYGLEYIKARYGDPNAAWAFWQAQSPHWY